MNKICTTIEQSKKLIELGIDVNTADFMWEYNPDKETYCNKPTIIPIDDYIFVNDIPAWSLSALLELIPPYLGEFNDEIDFGFGKAMNGKWYSAYYIQLDITGLPTFSKTVTGDTPVDAAFELVVWLKENDKI